MIPTERRARFRLIKCPDSRPNLEAELSSLQERLELAVACGNDSEAAELLRQKAEVARRLHQVEHQPPPIRRQAEVR